MPPRLWLRRFVAGRRGVAPLTPDLETGMILFHQRPVAGPGDGSCTRSASLEERYAAVTPRPDEMSKWADPPAFPAEGPTLMTLRSARLSNSEQTLTATQSAPGNSRWQRIEGKQKTPHPFPSAGLVQPHEIRLLHGDPLPHSRHAFSSRLWPRSFRAYADSIGHARANSERPRHDQGRSHLRNRRTWSIISFTLSLQPD